MPANDKLAPDQRKELEALMVGAFEEAELARLLRDTTGDRLFVDVTHKHQTRRAIVAEIVDYGLRTGSLEQLVRAAADARPLRDDIARFSNAFAPRPAGLLSPPPQVALSAQAKGLLQPDAPENAGAPGFERNIRPHLPDVDALLWGAQLSAVTRQVCRIDRNGAGIGTGFLVGPDRVLTNFHVVPTADVTGFVCRFDYHTNADGTHSSGVKSAMTSVLDSLPYSHGENKGTPDTPPPTDEELDFALVQIADDRGSEIIAGTKRGWMKMPMAPVPLAVGNPILIMQHPRGSPMKLAMDTDAVLRVPSQAFPRLRYATKTEEGSSGSPVFSLRWDLVALHHYGDPAWKATFNQGVPAHLITARLVAKGLA